MNDSARIKILQSVLARDLTPGQAAEILNVTPRHLSRLLKRYRESGPLGMNNRSRGKPSNSRLPVSLSTSILKIILEKYKDFGPTLVREKLDEIHGITVGKETIRRLMIAAGLWVPRKMRAPKIQQPRYRRACIGELIQIDGCDHEWFEDRASRCTLLVYVDDATSKLMHLRFVHCETTFTYFELQRHNNLAHLEHVSVNLYKLMVAIIAGLKTGDRHALLLFTSMMLVVALCNYNLWNQNQLFHTSRPQEIT
ncbi:helix-turn-helix domain containing protein [Salmonella enterica]|nr:helix-turn-helix domain containing protein [Salmonella enterica]